jgi:hypothetical protein
MCHMWSDGHAGARRTVLYYSLLTQLPIFVLVMALFAMLFSSQSSAQPATLAIVGVR